MKPVIFAPGYEVDRQGTVYRNGLPHPPLISKGGQLRVYFKLADGATCRLLSRVVGEAYFPNYSRRLKPVHLDGDLMNCRADNLRWDGLKVEPDLLLPTDLNHTGLQPKPLAGSDGYAVHAEGYISRKGKPLLPSVSVDGSLRLSIRMKRGHYDGVSVGREVGKAFDPNYREDLLLAFKDGNRINCALSNLRWVPRNHYAKGCPGAGRRTARLTDDLVLKLRSGELTPAQVMQMTGADQSTIWSARRGKTWTHI